MRLGCAGVPILCTSWRPILLAALILAQKVWDDRSLHNVDFSMFCPMFTLKEINHLEKKFLELIEYDVSVSSSLYASYYFQLRTLCQRENNGQEPALKPMDVETAQKLEARPSPPRRACTPPAAPQAPRLATALALGAQRGPPPSPATPTSLHPRARQARGLSKTAELKKSSGKTWQSANDVDATSVVSFSAKRG